MAARLHFSMSGAGSPVLPPCTSIKRTRQNRTRPMRVVIALILVLLPTVAVAQPSQGVVTMLSGQATLTRRAPVPPQPLRFKDDLFEYDRVNTGERSLVRVLLDGKALVTVRELSVFTVAEETRAQTVRLTWGKLAVVRLRIRSSRSSVEPWALLGRTGLGAPKCLFVPARSTTWQQTGFVPSRRPRRRAHGPIS